MKNETKTEFITQTQNSPKQSRVKKWTLNLIAVAVGFIMICGVLGILDILAQRELRKTGDALPKLFLYRWKKDNIFLAQYTQFLQLTAHDPLIGPGRDVEKSFPNLVEDHLPYIIANYYKIFIRQSDIAKFETHSKMQPFILTHEFLAQLERPFIVCLGGSTTDPFLPRLKIDLEKNYSIVANGTWSEELSRMMEKEKIKGTVFCGGTSCYNVFDDLLKLLRDVLEIKPDIVISYGGVNDLGMRRDFKIHNRYSYIHNKELLTSRTSFKCPIFPNLARYIVTKKWRGRNNLRQWICTVG
jgi:hypothetical protein